MIHISMEFRFDWLSVIFSYVDLALVLVNELKDLDWVSHRILNSDLDLDIAPIAMNYFI